MRTDETGSAIPGWIASAFDAEHVARTRTPGSHLRATIAGEHGGVMLTHVGHELLAYWHWARGDKPMPTAQDIRPEDMRDLLPYVRYLSWDRPDRLVFRVFGSALTAALGADLTGHNLLDHFMPEEIGVEAARLKLLHAHPCGAVMHRRFHATSGESYPVEILNLPVVGGDDGHARVLGCIMAVDAPQPWVVTYDRSRPMDTVAAVAVDLGHGVPDHPL